ncbi:50S ribosomal protein L5 [Candidatus Woesebacteria bacterium RIFCSPHIGHO2_01_FULL_44_10]|uniref:Large ribosomal subunit protein uL5 n=1 Tax=Candidatus Woesebacteria bacterium RIFCSPLOWO2_01_FULL_44_14 TaxID=1802525 RepID=A0A1F8C3G1_9BACT|nr:MAG: 50S ribosomal protein L5 [Candidatus Woesebacteria bacterium RIFCSPHIGHO2_01_FULL_44_10]OGM54707.1 MAG: 50S ribosomal protein L5 [Candidatus Woesebacteria bacterium RIFCSPHIGHO2_12_FULL_44_11]OGM70178.1 MAG: 50S ribosomal protein L5 [Candidatus Woesebacteria bacterium RIFCSPLOWO2_01_FULL_44_14]
MSLKQKYESQIRPALMKEFEITNVMAVPKMEKIVVNMGTQDILKDKGVREQLMSEFAKITGQTPNARLARISVAGFGVREGNPVGLAATLRGGRMYDFFERLVAVVLPRQRDFRGVPTKSFDGSGNYTLGIAEHTVFPEVDMAKVDKPRGLEITIVTNTKSTDRARKLLELLGMPFAKEEESGKN